jgi:restriction system protein
MIPDYQTLMLPLLRLAADGKELRVGDVVGPLAKQLAVTEADMEQMLPSGKQPIFYNRVHWAKTYMAQAKLLESTRHAHFRITERGREVLRENPAKIDTQLLQRFSEFQAFKTRSRDPEKPSSEALNAEPAAQNTLATPDELLRTTIADLDAILSVQLLDRVLAAPPTFFEGLIVDLLLSMGYGGSSPGRGPRYRKKRRWRH